MSKILGIDPGLRVTGYGVIHQDKQKFTYESSGTIKTTKQDLDLAARIKIIVTGIDEVIEKFSPNIVAIEKVFVNTNPQSTLLLGQARGAAIAAIVSKEINIYEYTALQIKKICRGEWPCRQTASSNYGSKITKITFIAWFRLRRCTSLCYMSC